MNTRLPRAAAHLPRSLLPPLPLPLLFSREMFLKRPDDIREFASGE